MTNETDLDSRYFRFEFIDYLDRVDPALCNELLSQEIVTLIGSEQHTLSAYISVHEGITSQDIRKGTSLALRVRDRLTEWRGYEYPSHVIEVFASFVRGKHSYADIAYNLNRRIENALRRYLTAKSKPQIDHDPKPISNNGLVVIDSTKLPDYLIDAELGTAREILQAMRFDESRIDPLLHEWLDYLESGEVFFSREYPIDRDKVISAVRYWDNKNPPPVAETGQV